MGGVLERRLVFCSTSLFPLWKRDQVCPESKGFSFLGKGGGGSFLMRRATSEEGAKTAGVWIGSPGSEPQNQDILIPAISKVFASSPVYALSLIQPRPS